MFNERLRYYRAINELTVSALAHKIGVSRSVYSQFESGEKRPNQQELNAIVDVLKINVHDLFACGGSGDIQFRHGSFRKNANLRKIKQRKIIAEIEDRLRKVITLRHIIGRSTVITPPKCNTLSYTNNADENASRLREHLGLAPRGPISNLVDIIENTGILLCECNLNERSFSGVNGYVDNIPYIAYRGNMSVQRIRSTITHELVHLMFAWPDGLGSEEEKVADAIGGCFLLTNDDAKREMGSKRRSIFNDGFLVCKEYGVSIMLLAVRLKELGILSCKDYKNFCIMAGKKGWRSKEPTVIRAERPALFRQYVLRAIDEGLISVRRGAEFLNVPYGSLVTEMVNS